MDERDLVVGDVGEIHEPPSEEAVAEIAEAAVEIAEIEAERDIEIAETQAEVALEIADAAEQFGVLGDLERHVEELRAWQAEHGPADHAGIWAALATLEASLLSISEQLTSMQTPPENTQPVPSENPPSDAESGEAAAGAPNDEQPPAPQPEPEAASEGKRRHRWI